MTPEERIITALRQIEAPRWAKAELLETLREPLTAAIEESVAAAVRSMRTSLAEHPLPDYERYAELEWTAIEAPLAWQDGLDRAGLDPNMRGCARFWRTVEEATGLPFYRNGAPGCSEITFPLPGHPGVGVHLEIDSDDEAADFRYGFVRIEKESGR